MKTIKTMDLTLEDFFLIGKPEYLSKYSHLDQNYGRGLGYMRDKLLPALALLTLFQALFFIAVISFSTDGEFVIAWYVINAASLGLFVTLLLTTLILTPERLAENYELAFWWGMISIFSIPLWITSLVSIFSARTADQFVLYWLLMGGSALLWYLIFYIRVTRQIKKGEYRKDGGGFWGKKLRHFFLGGGGGTSRAVCRYRVRTRNYGSNRDSPRRPKDG